MSSQLQAIPMIVRLSLLVALASVAGLKNPVLHLDADGPDETGTKTGEKANVGAALAVGPPSDPDTDWLWGVRTGVCSLGQPHGENLRSPLAIAAVTAMFVLAIVGVVAARPGVANKEASIGNIEDAATGAQTTASRAGPIESRSYHLDIARICCVGCVVVEHTGGTVYTQHNLGWVLQWVLPFLFLVSGICYMRSSSPLKSYVVRLLIVLCVGVGANWGADIVSGRDWQHDFGNTVFQMFYVVMLIAMAFIAAPLREDMRWRLAHPTAQAFAGVIVRAAVWMAVTWLALAAYIAGFSPFHGIGESTNGWLSNAGPILDNIAICLVQVFGTISLCSLACALGTTDMIGWVALAWIFVPRVATYYDNVGYPHNVELYVYGMAVQAWPLRGSKMIVQVVRSYWGLLFYIFLFLSMPSMYGRCDVAPPHTVLERFRFYVIECMLNVIFVSGAMATTDPYHVTPWLNYWALYAYCFHVCWSRLLPVPYGAIATFALIPVFCIGYWKLCPPVRGHDKSGAEEEGEALNSKSS